MTRTVDVCGMRVQARKRDGSVWWSELCRSSDTNQTYLIIVDEIGWGGRRNIGWAYRNQPARSQRAGVSERPVTVSRLGLCSQTNSFVIRNKHSSYMIKWSLSRPSKCAGWAVKAQYSFSPQWCSDKDGIITEQFLFTQEVQLVHPLTLPAVDPSNL